MGFWYGGTLKLRIIILKRIDLYTFIVPTIGEENKASFRANKKIFKRSIFNLVSI